MEIDTIAITALIVGILGALGSCIRAIHLRKIKCCCINSSCVEERKRHTSTGSLATPPETPITVHTSHETQLSEEQIDILLKRLTERNQINYIV